MQATYLYCPSFDRFPLLKYGFVQTEVDVGWCNFVQAFVVALIIVVIDERFNLGFKITGREVIF